MLSLTVVGVIIRTTAVGVILARQLADSRVRGNVQFEYSRDWVLNVQRSLLANALSNTRSVRFAHTAHVCRWRSKPIRALVKEERECLRAFFADICKICMRFFCRYRQDLFGWFTKSIDVFADMCQELTNVCTEMNTVFGAMFVGHICGYVSNNGVCWTLYVQCMYVVCTIYVHAMEVSQ